MLRLGLVLAVPLAAVAAVLVYADATRRDLPAGLRTRWTAGVAAGSALGVLTVFGLDGALFRAVAGITGGPVVVTAPWQLVALLSGVALVVSAGAVLVYGLGSRLGPLAV